MIRLNHLSVIAVALAATVTPGCKKPIEEVPAPPQYANPLPPGASALRKITDPARLPNLALVASQLHDHSFRVALKRSHDWFAIDSTQQHFPLGDVSHERGRASVFALSRAPKDPAAAQAFLMDKFDVYESVGWDNQGTVLCTAYYSPEFRASLVPTAEYRYPVYRRPSDLQTDARTGEVIGDYPARAQLETSGQLRGLELVYFRTRLEAYIVEVNGSAKLTLTDGSVLHIGYAGTNGREYTSLGKELVKDGKIDPNRVSLPAIRAYFLSHPSELDSYIQRNERFVFFKEYDGGDWPAGSLGFKVTPMRSLATDKSVFPRGGAVFIDVPGTQNLGSVGRPIQRLMVDQDTGGAIRAAGRADIYLGIGAEAERVAGHLASEGRLFYFFLKPEYVSDYVVE